MSVEGSNGLVGVDQPIPFSFSVDGCSRPNAGPPSLHPFNHLLVGTGNLSSLSVSKVDAAGLISELLKCSLSSYAARPATLRFDDASIINGISALTPKRSPLPVLSAGKLLVECNSCQGPLAMLYLY